MAVQPGPRPLPRPTRGHPRRPPEVYLRRRIAVFGGIPVALALVIYAIVSGLSGSAAPTRTTTTSNPRATAAVAHAAIGVRMLTFVDPSRSTYNYTTGAVTKGRRIVVELRYPATVTTSSADVAVPDAPIAKRVARPMVVFAPGYRLRPSDYAPLLDGWVRAGYLVASVEFPATTYPASDVPYAAHLPHGTPEADLYLEPGDLAFGIGAVEQLAATPGKWLNGLVNAHAVVLAGHSDGGDAVAALVYDAADVHSGLEVRAVAVLSGAEFPIANQTYGQPSSGSVPLLVVQSAADQCDPPSAAVQLYNAIGAPKYFDELATASHLGAYNGVDHGAFAIVQRTTAAFFAAAIGARRSTEPQLAVIGSASGVATLVSGPTLAPIPAPSGTSTARVCPAD
jgi:hypothetical protein